MKFDMLSLVIGLAIGYLVLPMLLGALHRPKAAPVAA